MQSLLDILSDSVVYSELTSAGAMLIVALVAGTIAINKIDTRKRKDKCCGSHKTKI